MGNFMSINHQRVTRRYCINITVKDSTGKENPDNKKELLEIIERRTKVEKQTLPQN